MVRTVFFDFCCTFSNSPNQEQPQGDASRAQQRSRGCSAYWGGLCSRFLMFLQVYSRQVFDVLPVRLVPGLCVVVCWGRNTGSGDSKSLNKLCPVLLLFSPATLTSVFLCLLFVALHLLQHPGLLQYRCYFILVCKSQWNVSGKYQISANWFFGNTLQ